MRVKKKYDEGGMFEVSRRTKRKIRKASKKSARKKQKREDEINKGTPSNPRFLIGAPTRVNGDVPSKPKEKEKKKKSKVKNPRGRSGVAAGTRRALKRAVDASCRKPGSCP